MEIMASVCGGGGRTGRCLIKRVGFMAAGDSSFFFTLGGRKRGFFKIHARERARGISEL